MNVDQFMDVKELSLETKGESYQLQDAKQRRRTAPKDRSEISSLDEERRAGPAGPTPLPPAKPRTCSSDRCKIWPPSVTLFDRRSHHR